FLPTGSATRPGAGARCLSQGPKIRPKRQGLNFRAQTPGGQTPGACAHGPNTAGGAARPGRPRVGPGSGPWGPTAPAVLLQAARVATLTLPHPHVLVRPFGLKDCAKRRKAPCPTPRLAAQSRSSCIAIAPTPAAPCARVTSASTCACPAGCTACAITAGCFFSSLPTTPASPRWVPIPIAPPL